MQTIDLETLDHYKKWRCWIVWRMSASSSISSFGCFHDFLKVENTILESSFELKNGIAAKKIGF
jgi:hypothetical protein